VFDDAILSPLCSFADTNLQHLACQVGDPVYHRSSPTAFGYIFMANPAEPAMLADCRREPVVETALRLTQELLRLRPEGTSSDQWLANIYGLAHAMAEVATGAGARRMLHRGTLRLPGIPSCPSL
jgi:hypothetical protein